MSLVKIKVDINEKCITDKLERICDDNETLLEIHNLLAKKCDPYVPMDEGNLAQSVRVYPDYIEYTVPYARYQYYGIGFNHTVEKHPLASAMWDKAMMRDHGDEFVAQVKEILMRRARYL